MPKSPRLLAHVQAGEMLSAEFYNGLIDTINALNLQVAQLHGLPKPKAAKKRKIPVPDL